MGTPTLELSAEDILSNIERWSGEYSNSYVEYGRVNYEDADSTDQLIILAYWHDDPLAKIGKMLQAKFEDAEVTVQFNDEWVCCSECGVWCRTTPTHYGWQPNYVTTTGDIVCRSCVEADPDYVLGVDHGFVDETNKALPSWGQALAENDGWTCFEPEEGCAHYENGWYPGQTDTPEKIVEYLAETLPNHHHLFVLTSVGQFDVHWTVLVKPMEDA